MMKGRMHNLCKTWNHLSTWFRWHHLHVAVLELTWATLWVISIFRQPLAPGINLTGKMVCKKYKCEEFEVKFLYKSCKTQFHFHDRYTNGCGWCFAGSSWDWSAICEHTWAALFPPPKKQDVLTNGSFVKAGNKPAGKRCMRPHPR